MYYESLKIILPSGTRSNSKRIMRRRYCFTNAAVISFFQWISTTRYSLL